MLWAAGGVFLVAVVVLYLGLFKPAELADKKTGESPSASQLWSTFAMLMFIAFALYSCGTEDESKVMPEGSVSERVKWLDSNISDVNEINNGLMITYQTGTISSEERWAYSLFNAILEIMPHLNEAANGTDLQQVTFMVRINTVDNMGKGSTELAMKVFYQYPEFANAQWGNMTPWNMMETLDDIQFQRFGKELGLSYCNADDGKNIKYSPNFCERVLNHALKFN